MSRLHNFIFQHSRAHTHTLSVSHSRSLNQSLTIWQCHTRNHINQWKGKCLFMNYLSSHRSISHERFNISQYLVVVVRKSQVLFHVSKSIFFCKCQSVHFGRTILIRDEKKSLTSTTSLKCAIEKYGFMWKIATFFTYYAGDWHSLWP